MRIAIIGAGMIGGTLARSWQESGHRIVLGVREPGRAAPLLSDLGKHAEAMALGDAAAAGEVVVFAAPYGAWPEFADLARDALAGKVVIDAANPYPERDGAIAAAALRRGSGPTTAGFLPGSRVVKAFNTLYWKDLAARRNDGIGMALAADDPAAVDTATALIDDAGFAAVAAGGIDQAWRFDPGQPAYARTLPPDALRAALAQARPPEGDLT